MSGLGFDEWADREEARMREADVDECNEREMLRAMNPDGEESEELVRLRQWIDDLQSDMYINCVYCGHRYGPNDEVPSTMADILKEHIEQCSKHPMAKMKRRLDVAQRKARIVCEIVESVENRCMAADGPVTPTLQEMSEEELRELWQAANAIATISNPESDNGR